MNVRIFILFHLLLHLAISLNVFLIQVIPSFQYICFEEGTIDGKQRKSLNISIILPFESFIFRLRTFV